MTGLHVLMAVLAVGRITEVITQDRITDGFRDWWNKKGWPDYFWTCPRCVSVWAGAWCAIMFYVFPFANWPFALSFAYLLIGDIRNWFTSKTKRGIRIEPLSMDRMNIDTDGHNPQAVLMILRRMTAMIEQQMPKPPQPPERQPVLKGNGR